MVKASGNAKQDQSLYIGTYNKISNYNGHHAYEREGKERLYIYFYSSLVRPRQDFLLSIPRFVHARIVAFPPQADNLNVWVMGPELGEFIAGIRNEDDQQCVTDETRWLYASRASVWKSDDRSLAVKCYEPEGEIGKMMI